jgi:phosphatidylglycerophosphate synthase
MAEEKQHSRVYLSPLDKLFSTLGDNLVPFVPRHVRPNQITAVSVVFGLSAGAFFYLAGINRMFFIGAFFCILIHTILDFVDGSVARLRGQASKAGAFFDFFSDVIVVIVMFIGIGFSAYASWYVMAFPIVLYAAHSLLMKLWEENTGELLFPSFGDCELFLSLILVSAVTFILDNKPVRVLQLSLQPFDVILGLMSVYSAFELFALAFKLFKRLSRQEPGKP